jgi:hypothetical protein
MTATTIVLYVLGAWVLLSIIFTVSVCVLSSRMSHGLEGGLVQPAFSRSRFALDSNLSPESSS